MNMKTLNQTVWTNPLYFTAFGFGTGLSRFAPGTVGTLAALPIFALIYPCSASMYLLICALLFLLGIPICSRVTHDIGIDDYKGIVWDEVVGFLVTMYLIPVSFSTVLAGFILFRLFDILKPPPINWVEARIKGGPGIMIDDLLAGIFACLVLHALLWTNLI